MVKAESGRPVTLPDTIHLSILSSSEFFLRELDRLTDRLAGLDFSALSPRELWRLIRARSVLRKDVSLLILPRNSDKPISSLEFIFFRPDLGAKSGSDPWLRVFARLATSGSFRAASSSPPTRPMTPFVRNSLECVKFDRRLFEDRLKVSRASKSCTSE
eukprot:1566208-Rhodomonas_salina.2